MPIHSFADSYCFILHAQASVNNNDYWFKVYISRIYESMQERGSS